MSLSKEQKKDLQELGRYLRDIEKIAVENNLDLDVYMSDYKEEGFEVYATERITLEERADSRKNILEKSRNAKTAKTATRR